MNSPVEIVEVQFEEFKSQKISDLGFFTELFKIGAASPRAAYRKLVENIYDWVNSSSDKQSSSFAFATFGLAFAAFHEENYEKSLSQFAEAEALFSELNDENAIALCKIACGGIYRALGNIDLSFKYLLEGSHQLKGTNAYSFFQMICNYQLGGIYAETKSYEKAQQSFQQCLLNAQEAKNINFIVLSLAGLGEVHHHLKQEVQAQDYLEQALRASEGANNRNFHSRVLSDFGTFYLDGKNFEKAIELHQQALTIREDLKIHGGAITNMVQISRIYLSQKKVTEALSLLNKALAKAEELKVKPKIYQIHFMLSEIFEKQKRVEEGLYHFKIYHAISNEVNKEDGEKKAKRSEMIFEAEQTKKENAIIKAQKVAIEKKNKELQETIDELTLSKINRKAKAITTGLAILLIILEDCLLHFIVSPYIGDNFLISLAATFAVVVCIKPIEKTVEHYLLNRFVRLKSNGLSTI